MEVRRRYSAITETKFHPAMKTAAQLVPKKSMMTPQRDGATWDH